MKPPRFQGKPRPHRGQPGRTPGQTLLAEPVDGADRPERADVDPYAVVTEDELLQQLSERLG